MSNYLAIATVTAALKQIIQEAINVIGDADAIVKLGRPEIKETAFSGVHLYLYMIRPNEGLNNNALPTRLSDGTVVHRPQTALDLYYIISFYGDETQLIPQRLMGSTICAIQAQPVLTKERIREVTKPGGPYTFLTESDLEQQIETVKFTPVYLSNEDFSKLWSVFLQVPHRLFVTYQASVVLLDSQIPIHKVKIVKKRNIRAILEEEKIS